MAKKINFRAMARDELEKKLADSREEIRVLRFKSQGAKSKNVKEELALRKNIARILTIFHEEK
ncbi:50S ribosomal protein L29 [Candidatus Nomurabacteria bacterium RIFCSPLOWO2_01_FULL_46_18]|uniref:Large ribosomal subunit protein uL29 n=1 Tax=Candidatus Nomurabacteria bacterium RIFCSPLOWO2_01_FULL_46_18 TaxID=1801783 RepID=A0A1F6XB82_9BACT|nr:MAG: 50S ribosomal protein L29 [Candidatus Nomurabacteria bacterium RIFCSPLOWO2_01_FULL_46_18]